MTIQRMDHVGVVVDDLDAAISFFVKRGLELEGGETCGDIRIRETSTGNRLAVAFRGAALLVCRAT